MQEVPFDVHKREKTTHQQVNAVACIASPCSPLARADHVGPPSSKAAGKLRLLNVGRETSVSARAGDVQRMGPSRKRPGVTSSLSAHFPDLGVYLLKLLRSGMYSGRCLGAVSLCATGGSFTHTDGPVSLSESQTSMRWQEQRTRHRAWRIVGT